MWLPRLASVRTDCEFAGRCYFPPSRPSRLGRRIACRPKGHRCVPARSTHVAFTVTEVVVALVILSCCAMCLAKLVLWSHRSQRTAEVRYAATQVAANVLQQAMTVPWEELNEKWAREVKIPGELRQIVPDLSINVSVQALSELDYAKRIVVRVEYSGPSGLPMMPIELTTIRSARSAPLEPKTP